MSFLLLKGSRTLGLVALFLFLAFPCAFQTKPQKNASGAKTSVLTPRQIAAQVSKSLVMVLTYDIDGKPLAQGSGFVYGVSTALQSRKTSDPLNDLGRSFFNEVLPKTTSKSSPIFVSNLHVFKRATSARIKPVGEEKTFAVSKVIAVDPRKDICVFQVEGYSAAPLLVADTELVGLGDDIFVSGAPQGLENTFSKGLVSGIRKDQGYIQIDAPISQGSSGGPVVNSRSEVVGIATSSLESGQQLNFAVSAYYLWRLVLDWNAKVDEIGAFAITDKEEAGLTGRVKSVEIKVAEKRNFEDNLNAIPPAKRSRKTYNEDGNETESITYDSDGNVSDVFTFGYDYRGVRSNVAFVSTEFDSAQKTYSKKEVLELKLKNRGFGVTKETEYKAKGGSMVKESTTFDRFGNMTVKSQMTDNGREQKTVFVYDERGRCVQELRYRDGKLFTTTNNKYKLDAFGNWISKLELVTFPAIPDADPIPQKLTIREIVYY